MGQQVTLYIAGENGVSTGETRIFDTRSLEEARAEATARIETEAARRGEVYWVTIRGQARPYQIDASSRLNIAGAAADAAAVLSGVPGAAWPDGFCWIAADNSQQPMTAACCFEFGQAVKGYIASLVYARRTLKDAVLALPDRKACDRFDETQGWPENASRL